MVKQTPPTLDLHNFQASDWQFFESELFQKLDEFIYQHSRSKINKVAIVVGKGLSSRRLIEGKNPLRYYTEQYLNQTALEWTNADHFSGGSGVIWVWL